MQETGGESEMARGQSEQPKRHTTATRNARPKRVKGFTATEIVLVAMALLLVARLFGRLI